jgi:alpha-beta hydrolase superfamily lysophospholipase
VRLATYRYPAKETPKAVVILFHSLNTSQEYGAHIAHELAEHNIETVGFDHRGFGRS